MKTDKENMIRDIVNSSPFYNNPNELRIRDFESVKFIHKMVSARKSEFVSHFSTVRL
jgi:hypothetical protein